MQILKTLFTITLFFCVAQVNGQQKNNTGMMKFRFLIVSIIFLCFFPIFLSAKKIDMENAERIALNHIASKNLQLRNTSVTPENRLNLVKSASPENNYYVFNRANGNGFIIVSGDDVAMPILGYSNSGSYDENNLVPSCAYWLNALQHEIAFAIENDMAQTEKVRMAWERYLNGNNRATLRAGTVIVEPLIQTHWGQEEPYNNLCPNTQFSARNLPTGCVATAMAQVMKYYNYPLQGTGASSEYQTTGSEKINIPSVAFNVPYDWDNMLNNYFGTETTAQKNAVATLMYHCGVSIYMDYQFGGSASSIIYVAKALPKYFLYDASILEIDRDCFDDITWNNILKEQLDKGQPVYYEGGQHAFICDGYDEEEYFHFNWGWSGDKDGWYLTTALAPGPGGTGSGSGKYDSN
jgi:hypothetical protein